MEKSASVNKLVHFLLIWFNILVLRRNIYGTKIWCFLIGTCTRMWPAMGRLVSSTMQSFWMSFCATHMKFLSSNILRISVFPERNFKVPTQYRIASPDADTCSLLSILSNESRHRKHLMLSSLWRFMHLLYKTCSRICSQNFRPELQNR